MILRLDGGGPKTILTLQSVSIYSRVVVTTQYAWSTYVRSLLLVPLLQTVLMSHLIGAGLVLG